MYITAKNNAKACIKAWQIKNCTASKNLHPEFLHLCVIVILNLIVIVIAVIIAILFVLAIVNVKTLVKSEAAKEKPDLSCLPHCIVVYHH